MEVTMTSEAGGFGTAVARWEMAGRSGRVVEDPRRLFLEMGGGSVPSVG